MCLISRQFSSDATISRFITESHPAGRHPSPAADSLSGLVGAVGLVSLNPCVCAFGPHRACMHVGVCHAMWNIIV